jgi:hypothetical protein
MDIKYDFMKLRCELKEQKEHNNERLGIYESVISKMQGFNEMTKQEHYLLIDLKRLVNYLELKNDVIDIKLNNTV